jgi:hypothetical protein
VIVTILGGTVQIGNLTFTSIHEALPSLEVGDQYLLLLKRAGDTYRIAGNYYGVFQISHGKLFRRTKKQGFAEGYEGASAQKVAQEITTHLRERTPSRLNG